MRNERGQFTIEAVLIMTLLLGISLSVMRYAKDQQWMATLVSGPWKPLQGMIEDGVWRNPKDSKAMNPHLKERHGSFEGEDVPGT